MPCRGDAVEYASHKNNSFDVLRHIAALLVIYSHHRHFASAQEPVIFGFTTYGGLAVQIFFAISGYLVTESFVRSATVVDYFGKRIRRIFPALIVCSFIIVYPMTAFYYGGERIEYLLSPEAFQNFLSMAGMLAVSIPKVMVGPVDGALWTLPMEFVCYLIAALALSFSKSWKTPALLLVGALLTTILASDATKQTGFYGIVFSWLLLDGMCFAVGALMARTRESWDDPRVKLCLAIFSVYMLLMLMDRPERLIVGYISVPVLTIVLGMSIPDFLIKGRFDISYGLYIYAWPVQRTVIANTPHMPFANSLALTILITSAFATASWFLVEKPMTRMWKRKGARLDVLAPKQA